MDPEDVWDEVETPRLPLLVPAGQPDLLVLRPTLGPAKVKFNERIAVQEGGQRQPWRQFPPPSTPSTSGKRKKVNGYLLFVYNRKGRLEREKGQKMTQPLPQLLGMFDTEWKELPEEEKEMWRSKAKEQNGQASETASSSKAWTQQVSYTVPVYNAVDDDTKTHQIREFLEESVIDVTLRAFAVINFNIYYKHNQMEFIPAELGIAVFSLTAGVTYEMHTLIHPREPNLSNVYETKLVVEEYGLPLPVFEAKDDRMETGGTSDYENVLRGIKTTLDKANDTGGYNVCFARDEHIRVVDGCLNWIMRKAGASFEVKVYSLDTLLYELSKNKNGRFGVNCIPTEHTATVRLQGSSALNYRQDLACTWHQQKRYCDIVSKCALHKSKTQAFIALELLTRQFGIEPIIGFHAPPAEVIKKVSTPLYKKDDEDARVGPTSLEIHEERKSRFAARIQSEARAKANQDLSVDLNEQDDVVPDDRNDNEEETTAALDFENNRMSVRMKRSMQNLYG